MQTFHHRGGELHCEGVPVASIIDEVRTPAFIYSQAAFVDRLDALTRAFADVDPLICYSVKANGNLAVLRLVKDRGAGFDVVSGGELYRTMKVEADPQRVVFAGVGKTDEELRYALRKQIFLFNVESEPELLRIHELAREMGQRARVALRVNPDVDPRTHRYIATGKRASKFGIDLERARDLLGRVPALDGIELLGLHMHIGSQITSVEPFEEALARLLDFADAIRSDGLDLKLLNLGGGFGIDYTGEQRVPSADELAQAIVPPVRERGYRLLLEPGRYIAGNAGVLVTRVTFVKEGGDGRRFIITDTGMNSLIRPALYGAHHRIGRVKGDPSAPAIGPADIVGPICESGDFLAQDRPFPEVRAGDLLCVYGAGAYAAVMASQYNAHPRAPEVLVDGEAFRVVRRRETYEDLVAHEL